MKIGIYGGTFNPPHLGHLTAAAAVIATLKLDKLLLIPAIMVALNRTGLVPFKQTKAVSETNN